MYIVVVLLSCFPKVNTNANIDLSKSGTKPIQPM